jgi:hypothetical protein
MQFVFFISASNFSAVCTVITAQSPKRTTYKINLSVTKVFMAAYYNVTDYGVHMSPPLGRILSDLVQSTPLQ